MRLTTACSFRGAEGRLDLRAPFGPSMGLVNWLVPAVQIDPKLAAIAEKAFHASLTATGHAKRLLPRLSTRTRTR